MRMNDPNALVRNSNSSPGVKFLLPSMTSPSPIAGEKSRFSSATKTSASTNYGNNNVALEQALNRLDNQLYTPKADRASNSMLISPSRSISETLTELATTTGDELEKIWDEVGCSNEERAAQLKDLLIKFKNICIEKIDEEKGVAEQFRKSIKEAKEEISKTAAALKTDVNFNSLLESTEVQTLTDEWTALEATLDDLRAVANEVKEDMKDCKEYIGEAHKALGIDMEVHWNDVDTDLTASRRAAFHSKRSEMKEELTTRTNAVVQLLRDCQHLMNDLRMEPEKDGSELDRRIAGSLVRSKDGDFIMASKFRSPTCVGISSDALEDLTHYVAELHREKGRRKKELQEMGSEIAILWEKLRIPEDEQRAFTKSVQGLGDETIAKGRQELNRLLALKSQVIGKLIQETRETILYLWDQVNATHDVRGDFSPFYIQGKELFNDTLLEKHESYIHTLESKLEQMKPILRLIDRREIIVKERFQYEELQKDSERLKQRGAAMTKQLMEEERMAKRIKKELPRLTSLVVEKIEEWKQTLGEDFLYAGESYLHIIERQEDEWNLYKAEEAHRKLKKKQEETAIENRFLITTTGKEHVKKVLSVSSRPLAENSRHNEQLQKVSGNAVRKLPSRE